MSDGFGRICFSPAPFLWLKRAFFHRRILWPVGGTLAVGLPLALAGVATEVMSLVLAGYLFTLPFQLWVALLAASASVLAVPRFAVLGLFFAALYLGLTGAAKRFAGWVASYEDAEPGAAADGGGR